MNQSKITIAIDGFSSCGKSTLAKDLASELNYIFIDSGAMYRAITLYALQLEGCIHNGEIEESILINALPFIELHFEINPKSLSPELILNGTNVESEIRTPLVSSFVSKIAVIKEVRKKLVEEQRKMGRNGGIVMDGRDIGSVVFPTAELKLFVTADIETRVNRRHKELEGKGITISREEVKTNLMERDHIDSNRSESPLIKTEDSILIDNTLLNRSEQLQLALDLAQNILDAKENYIR